MRKYQKILGLAAAILISVLILVFKDSFVKLQGYGLFGLFLLSIVGNATIILPTPVVLTAFIGGAIFHPFLVSLVVSLGATIGEMTGYMAGFGSSEVIEKDVGLSKVKNWVQKYGLWAIFILAAIPNPFFDLAGIVAGATGISVYKYLIVVFMGKFLKFAAFAYLGSRSYALLDKFI